MLRELGGKIMMSSIFVLRALQDRSKPIDACELRSVLNFFEGIGKIIKINAITFLVSWTNRPERGDMERAILTAIGFAAFWNYEARKLVSGEHSVRCREG